jgi:hypothetical protein
MKEKELKKEWITEAGLMARVYFVNESHHCGYVKVNGDSKLCGVDYDDPKVYDIEVHGGLTFSNTFYDENDEDWWFGYDCAHFGDRCLKFPHFGSHDTFRDVPFCVGECEKLATQLVEKDLTK